MKKTIVFISIIVSLLLILFLLLRYYNYKLFRPYQSEIDSLKSSQQNNQSDVKDLKKQLEEETARLQNKIDKVQPLDESEEQKVSDMLSRTFGFKVTPELEGKRLNRSYGLIGAEQHLSRFPGDTLSTHFDSEDERKSYWQLGMAPGLGAWRYFTNSADSLTELDKDREKYYIAVQTFLSKDFNTRFAEYRDFYKYRKMLVVNPNNGRAIVADIADAGPSEWTGKHLGGSPEVMHYLQRFDGRQRGPVLYFFIDEEDDKIPLGPIIL